MRGRKPIPTGLKLVTNNPGKRPINKDEPKPRSASRTPRAPRGLSKGARKVWRELAPELHRLGLLTVLDRGALAAYCEAEALFWAANAEYIKTGGRLLVKVGGKRRVIHKQNGDVVEEESQGAIQPNPLRSERSRAIQEMRQLGALFGLNPAERVRLKAVKPQEKQGPWDEF